MNNASMLAQERRAIRKKIDENPTTIIIARMPMIDDGFGGKVQNPYGTPAEHVYRVRISHERSGAEMAMSAASGFSTNLSRFILTDHLSEIEGGDIFEAIGKRFRIGPVDPLYCHDGIKGYQAPLVEAADVPDTPEEE